MRKMVLVSGSSNPALAQKISTILGIPLTDPNLIRFANGEICCQFAESVRGADVFVIQSTCSPVNDNLMELMIIVDALKRATAASITAVVPYYGYSRQDRKSKPRTPITAKLVADILTAAGVNRVMTMDLHAAQIQGFFNIPFDNIYASPVILDYVSKHVYDDNSICVSPDAGGVNRVRHYAKILGSDLALIDKRRTGPNVAQAMNLVGDVKGKKCILIDDICDTAGTLVEACRLLKEKGATRVTSCCTHPILSDPALERIKSCDELDELVVTDTIPLTAEAQKCEKITVLSTAQVFSKTISRVYECQSISDLFIELM